MAVNTFESCNVNYTSTYIIHVVLVHASIFNTYKVKGANFCFTVCASLDLH